HKKGILHRDIKPDYVMLGRFGEVFLVGWGIAKETGETDEFDRRRIRETRLSDGAKSLIAMARNVYGTPGYLSPEAARGEDDYTDGSSDVFALGAILYQILTLKPPFEGETAEEILEAARAGKVIPVASAEGARPHLKEGRPPDALAAIAMMALSPERENRYESAQDLRRDIEAFLQGHSTKAEEAGALKMTRMFVRRNPGTTTVWLVAAVAVVAILTSGLKENFQNRSEAEKALQLALEKKHTFLLEKSASTAVRAEAAPRFAQLAWDRITLGDTGRAGDLATAALDFDGGDEANARSHLVLGLSRILQGHPDLAEKHFEQAKNDPFLASASQPLSWTEHFEKNGLYALVLKQLEKNPEEQYRKLENFLSRKWNRELWELSQRKSEQSVLYRLVLKKGVSPSDLDFIRGWPIHHLVLENIPLADPGRLTDLTQLRSLVLGKGHLAKNLSPLTGLQSLTSLTVAACEDDPDFGFDLSPIAHMPQLRKVTIAGNVISFEPLRDLQLSHLRVGKLTGDTSLLSLPGMPLRYLEVENPAGFEGLSGMPLQIFRPGYSEAGYSEQSIRILTKLPLRELRLDGDFDEEFLLLTKSRTLEELETNHLHDLKIWQNSALQVIHLKGNDHNLSGLADSPVSVLKLSDTDRPVLHSLLRANQLREIRLPKIDHAHLETPALSKNLIRQDWSLAKAEFHRLKKRYSKHDALRGPAQIWLPVLEKHIEEAQKGIASATWNPKKYFDDHTYQWFKTPMTWKEAKSTAEALGGYLATVETEEEWNFLADEFGIPQGEDSVWSGGKNRIWIGAAKPGTAKAVKAPAIRNRGGEAPSVYIANQDLVLLPTSPNSVWSFIIEWDSPGEPL
ncbi:MAG: hypothetical protein P1V20_14715, partial [Verrucomicrobiales bacterium]|nr:hypothetical protein [Verrucomicrobiales bacterium]